MGLRGLELTLIVFKLYGLFRVCLVFRVLRSFRRVRRRIQGSCLLGCVWKFSELFIPSTGIREHRECRGFWAQKLGYVLLEGFVA